MKRTRLLVAGAVLAALAAVAAKLLFPDAAAALRRSTADTLTQGRDYAAAFAELSDWLSLRGGGTESPTPAPVPTASPTSAPTPTPAPAPRTLHFYVEEAGTLGERVPKAREEEPEPEAEPEPETAPEPPEAVAVFLAEQSAYLDKYALPDNVDYGYTEFPLDYAVPVAGYRSSGFGYRMHPILGTVRFHYGTDLAADAGENILAFADGVVTFAGRSDNYGNYAVIDHGGGWTSLYAHSSRLLVEDGQSVKAGEAIALVGATGLATGPHLHFELQRSGVYVNPEYYINA